MSQAASLLYCPLLFNHESSQQESATASTKLPWLMLDKSRLIDGCSNTCTCHHLST
jgi:hypothetical protein